MRFAYSTGSVGQPSSNRVKLIVELASLLAVRFAWHNHVGNLDSGHLACQRKHLVHSDPGSDRGITQARFANLLGHAFSAHGCHICEDGDQVFFSFCYAFLPRVL